MDKVGHSVILTGNNARSVKEVTTLVRDRMDLLELLYKHAGDADFDFLLKADCGSELACSPNSASKRASQR